MSDDSNVTDEINDEEQWEALEQWSGDMGDRLQFIREALLFVEGQIMRYPLKRNRLDSRKKYDRPADWPPFKAPGLFLCGRIGSLYSQIKDCMLRAKEMEFNEILLNWELTTDREDYEEKKRRAKWIGKYLREYDMALYHPESFTCRKFNDPDIDRTKLIYPDLAEGPYSLYALPTVSKGGRYTFENRVTKKRRGSYKCLTDMLPLRLTYDAPRKEGFLEKIPTPDDGVEPRDPV